MTTGERECDSYLINDLINELRIFANNDSWRVAVMFGEAYDDQLMMDLHRAGAHPHSTTK